jgi:hypothetical protein
MPHSTPEFGHLEDLIVACQCRNNQLDHPPTVMDAIRGCEEGRGEEERG